jgi:glycosyltransferase involved in cell wall biosynthesis
LVERFDPATLYIANGAEWLYAALPEIKRRFPELRTANQVYDYQVGWINRYDLATVTYMDAHIGATARICQAYEEKGARPDQVFLVEHAIDPAPLDPAAYSSEGKADLKRRLGMPPEGKVVTFASRLHPQKRPMDFVELARRFASDPSVAFLMVGDGQLAPQVDEEIHRTGLKNIVRHKFYRPISDVLAVTDVLVLPSEYEGMPLIVGEAQVMGKPVVVTDVGNNREVLAITGGGVVVPQIGDVGALADGVRRMLARPPDPARIREAVIANYGVEVISQKYRHVLLPRDHA